MSAVVKESLLRKPTQRMPVKLVNAVSGGLRRLGVKPAALDPDALCAEAVRQTRLEDFGDPGFREPLRALVDSFETEAGLHPFGRLAVRGTLVHALANRLWMRDYWRRHPESLEAPLARPLFILGLPRTGTTLLFNLLAQDPAHRWFANWEASTPAPPPGADERRKFAATLYKQFHYFMPELRHKHEVKPDDPEECNILLINSFESEILWFCYDIPGYRAWLNARDRVGGYAYYRDQLKLLQHQRAGSRWLLKSPTHLFAVDALLAVFPDACIVQTHRDPLKVLPSACSLQATVRGLCAPRVDYGRLGAETVRQLAHGLDRCTAARAKADPRHFHDLQYQDLIRDPIAAIKGLYRHFGFELWSEALERMQAYLAANPQHKHGVHRYSLAEFGLDAEAERARFAAYVERFGIPSER